MNDQSQMLKQPPPTMLNQVINQPPPQMMNQSQLMNQQVLGQQPQMINQQSQLMGQSQAMPPPPMMNRQFKPWSQQQILGDGSMKFHGSLKPNFAGLKQSKQGRGHWKGKKRVDMRMDRRTEKTMPNVGTSGPSGTGGYKPPSLNELQSQNRLKAKKFYPKRKFGNRFAPYAPRNTSSFLIRAKKSGGIASLVSPCPVTPAVLPTPVFSPSREVLGDMAKEEWGVDGYGSMKGLIRLRNEATEAHEEEDEEEGGGGSSDSDVEEHVEVERRLDHDLSRFEMIYPNYGVDYNNVLENRVDDQDTHIAQLEEENLTLKERLFLMENEVAELRTRLQYLERQNQVVEDFNEEVVENGSENESEDGVSHNHALVCEGKEDLMDFVSANDGERGDYVSAKEDLKENEMLDNKGLKDVYIQVLRNDKILKKDEMKGEAASNKNLLDEDNTVNDKSGSGAPGFELDEVRVTEAKGKAQNDNIRTDFESRLILKEDVDKSGAMADKNESVNIDENVTAEHDGYKDEERPNTCSEKKMGGSD